MKNQLYKLLSVISEKTELSLADICKEFSVSLSGQREAVIDGVLSVKKYESEEIVLSVCGACISVCGKCLELKSFHRAALCIKGSIEKIEVGGGQEK